MASVCGGVVRSEARHHTPGNQPVAHLVAGTRGSRRSSSVSSFSSSRIRATEHRHRRRARRAAPTASPSASGVPTIIISAAAYIGWRTMPYRPVDTSGWSVLDGDAGCRRSCSAYHDLAPAQDRRPPGRRRPRPPTPAPSTSRSAESSALTTNTATTESTMARDDDPLHGARFRGRAGVHPAREGGGVSDRQVDAGHQWHADEHCDEHPRLPVVRTCPRAGTAPARRTAGRTRRKPTSAVRSS